MSRPTPLALATLLGVVVCWLVHIAILLLRKRPPKAIEASRDKIATLGIVLQMCGYFLVWFQPPRQDFLPPVTALSGVTGVAFLIFTVGLAAASAWLSASAIRTLGKQWALPARLVEGHELITVGPYAYVRNPIYTAMLGMLIATGLAMEHWSATIVAVIVFCIGMVIRVRSEEKLLRVAFGEKFEDYARRVPAVIPGLY
jgi:protein-S-isoprenylcysteine O-methyltransferase Ste14